MEYAFVYENNRNEAWFGGAQLFREPFDYVYTTTMTAISRP